MTQRPDLRSAPHLIQSCLRWSVFAPGGSTCVQGNLRQQLRQESRTGCWPGSPDLLFAKSQDAKLKTRLEEKDQDDEADFISSVGFAARLLEPFFDKTTLVCICRPISDDFWASPANMTRRHPRTCVRARASTHSIKHVRMSFVAYGAIVVVKCHVVAQLKRRRRHVTPAPQRRRRS